MAADPDSIRGRLRPLSIVDVLEFLGSLNRVGLLTLGSGGVSVRIHLRRGRVVHAASTRDADRLIDFLVRRGILGDEDHARLLRLVAEGERVGKALVACGALTPRVLMEERRRQVREIVLSTFEWGDGTYEFAEGEEPDPESVAVEIDIREIVVEGIRSLAMSTLFRARLATRDWIYEPVAAADRKAEIGLEPHEQYVLDLVDGRRDIGALIALSEFPEEETLRVLFLLDRTGRVARCPAHAAHESGQDEATGEILLYYNRMFERIHGALMTEAGPIARELLERSLDDLRPGHPALLRHARIGGDGTLEPGVLEEALLEVRAPARRETLVRVLNEVLYAQLLVLRRTLGEAGERRVLRTFPRTGPIMAVAGGST